MGVGILRVATQCTVSACYQLERTLVQGDDSSHKSLILGPFITNVFGFGGFERSEMRLKFNGAKPNP